MLGVWSGKSDGGSLSELVGENLFENKQRGLWTPKQPRVDVGQSYFGLKDTIYILSATLGEKRLEDEADSWGAGRVLILASSIIGICCNYH